MSQSSLKRRKTTRRYTSTRRRHTAQNRTLFYYLPALRGLLALRNGEPSKAIALLQAASPYGFGSPRSSIQGDFGSLYPIFVRGQAYLAATQGAEAAIEFQKILAYRGIVIGDPVSAVAHLQMAAPCSISRDTTKVTLFRPRSLVLGTLHGRCWSNHGRDPCQLM